MMRNTDVIRCPLTYALPALVLGVLTLAGVLPGLFVVLAIVLAITARCLVAVYDSYISV